jgi:hypothetical protein
MFKVCANLEEAMEAADNKLLWLYYGGGEYGGWVPAHRDGDAPVRSFYGKSGWPPEDFAVLVEDDGEGDG